MMRKIACATLGCKTNQYDTEFLMEMCRRAGFEVVPFDEEVDAYIINTCTVTALADAQGRQMIRRARKRSPEALVIACGCSAEGDENDMRGMSEADAVFGVRSAQDVVSFLQNRWGVVEERQVSTSHVPLNQSRARALLKIQDGCDKRCTFCAVWQARGKSVSVEHNDVIKGYRALETYPEVMLTGIHIGQYGRDLEPRSNLAELVRHLLDERSGPRIRLSSLDPDECDAKLTELIGHPRVCRHVHLSVQSGSQDILGKMGRKYSPDGVRRIVDDLLMKRPGMAIGMDLIAGFPGETEFHHMETVRLVEDLPIAFLHVFPFSERPNAPASKFDNQVPHDERKRRARELIDLGKRKKGDFLRDQLGTTVEAVVISKQPDADGMLRAVTDNYVTVRAEAREGLYGQGVRVKISRIGGEEVFAVWE
jgi:threonylcarbamoyladenosine tRNA methylthiotransferase MtaB